ncbi:hypothetical protein V5740_10060 [Croceibacterium sp. TMG7-5b_MA50]|uniref:hypothetical protein n=1 Tax=Croceibacterium sp. TMG7-5b_MA50 TaxID=3121290 RepID=UPI003221B5CC
MTTASRPMLRRLTATVGVLALAGACLASGLDRVGARSFAVAVSLPQTVRAQSHRPVSQLALATNRPQAALTAAEAAVRSDPVDPASTALLGSARLLLNDFAGAEQAFRVAAAFGWREAMTQRYWYTAALQGGDYPRAAERLDALLRTHRNLPGADTLLAALEGEPQARAALLARLAARPLWLPTYLRPGPQLDDAALARRSDVLVALAGSGTVLGCEAVSPWVRGVLQRGNRASAQRVWQAHCPDARTAGLLADSDFNALGRGTAAPFGWTVERSGDVLIRAEEAQGEYRLSLENRSAFSRRVLVQSVALAPGRYRLRGVGSAGVFAASLACGTVPAMPRLVDGELAGEGQVLRVAEPCERLQLAIWLRPTPERVTLDRLTLQPL